MISISAVARTFCWFSQPRLGERVIRLIWLSHTFDLARSYVWFSSVIRLTEFNLAQDIIISHVIRWNSFGRRIHVIIHLCSYLTRFSASIYLQLVARTRIIYEAHPRWRWKPHLHTPISLISSLIDKKSGDGGEKQEIEKTKCTQLYRTTKSPEL